MPPTLNIADCAPFICFTTQDVTALAVWAGKVARYQDAAEVCRG